MKQEFPSLITSDAQAGLALASRLANLIHRELDQANAKVDRPGGTNLPLLPTVNILFYAIAAANNGWPRQ